MASFDVMPFNSEHGGHNRVIPGELGNAAGAVDATFRIGEFTILDVAAGDVNELAAGTTAVTLAVQGIHHVAASDSQFNVGRLGDARYVDPPFAGPPCSLYPLSDEGVMWKTQNVFNNTDTNIGPLPAGDGTMAGVTVGVSAGMRRSANGDHGIDINVAGFRIIRILDGSGKDTFETGAAADQVIFVVDPEA